ncbi:MAG TPA: cellulase family glycosylhydrolase, partial [Gemmatimonadaceae bacterium]|nr:cellulase family glycosylhydrolase [Gemmatimonadaceae bacterium]
MTKSGTGAGTVTSSVGGINCGSTCSATYASGTTVTLTAAAASGSTFAGWSNACSGTGSTCVVSMTAARTVNAAFNTSGGGTTYALTVGKAGTGAGTVTSNVGGINCGATCSASYASGTTVTLTAAAASGSTFAGWSGACTGTAATCSVSMTAARTVTATFNSTGGGTSIVAQHGRLRVCGNRICNAAGTPVQLKGMSWFWSNTGWGSERFYNRSAVASVKGWGATVVRAAIGAHGGGGYASGDATNPADPAGNMARARALIDAAIAEGVYVIVDWHSHELLQSQAQSFFQQLATAYASSPNLIWETYNEPTSQSWSSLKAYHTAVINTIRAAGSQNLVIVGSPTWSQDVDVASNDPIADTNTAYTLHFYAGTHTQYLRDKANTAMSRGRAIFVTEWGTCDASGNSNFSPTESQNWANWMDQNMISSANWSLNDKAETASALVVGASATGPWPDSALTQSGAWVKAYIAKTTGGGTTYALTVTKAGTGSGTVAGGAINCGATCSASIASGTTVTLTATPATGSTFAGWSGACTGTAATCAVSMTAARTVTATFNTSGGTTYTLSVTKAGTGSGTVAGGAISCGATCSASVASGTTVTLTASAASGSTFAGWSGACVGTAATCSVSMTAARTVTATFDSTGGGTSIVEQHGRLRVCGNRICNAAGTPVQLKGMSWFWS